MKKITYEVISLSRERHPRLPLVFHTDMIRTEKSINLSNWHEEIEILTVLEGEGTLHCDVEDHTMRKGDVAVINSGSLHSISSKGAVRYHCMIIDRDFCLEAGLDTSKLHFKRLINDPLLYRELLLAADNINAFLKEENVYLAVTVRARLLDALALLARDYALSSSETNRAEKEADIRIKRAIEYISKNVTEPITLDGIAAEVGISKYHLSREFKRMTDMTVFNFIILMRLKLAKRLMRDGCSVSESALSSGFENLSYFSKKFRSVQGITPSEYAMQHRRGVPRQ